MIGTFDQQKPFSSFSLLNKITFQTHSHVGYTTIRYEIIKYQHRNHLTCRDSTITKKQ